MRGAGTTGQTESSRGQDRKTRRTIAARGGGAIAARGARAAALESESPGTLRARGGWGWRGGGPCPLWEGAGQRAAGAREPPLREGGAEVGDGRRLLVGRSAPHSERAPIWG